MPLNMFSPPSFSVQGHLCTPGLAPCTCLLRRKTTVRAANDLWDPRAQSNSERLREGPRVAQPQACVRQQPHLSHSPWLETRPILWKRHLKPTSVHAIAPSSSWARSMLARIWIRQVGQAWCTGAQQKSCLTKSTSHQLTIPSLLRPWSHVKNGPNLAYKFKGP